ncbi:uncharacterized protein LOC120694754 isoform X2 [Panicum virgatum]|uniref:uncharacterized protein LOC120694754 isoform X2 n=1 Tax=Panicum virgatum TaxID=38727 RepID=UPI0019D59BAA|nr:uncharacterized protein LOC120694754 isoform X2 [Panicum virgatum]XP_039833944.1 uncharacterized protein LOC120694754 isoform X2 [Panicum virgatum]XP_039833945.1 uncharacterized protein LOC120694754 isoform X2 [Panicum virgatum]
MAESLQKTPHDALLQQPPPAAPNPNPLSSPRLPAPAASLSCSLPPPPLSSPAPLRTPHASARHGPAWIWRVAAYLPRLLVGERVLEGLFLLLLRPLRLRADRVPHLLLGRRRRRGVHRLLAGLGDHQLLRNRRREASPSRAPAPTPVLSAQGGTRRHGGGRGGGHAVGRDAGGQASPAPTPSRSPNLMTTNASDRFPIPATQCRGGRCIRSEQKTTEGARGGVVCDAWDQYLGMEHTDTALYMAYTVNQRFQQ